MTGSEPVLTPSQHLVILAHVSIDRTPKQLSLFNPQKLKSEDDGRPYVVRSIGSSMDCQKARAEEAEASGHLVQTLCLAINAFGAS